MASADYASVVELVNTMSAERLSGFDRVNGATNFNYRTAGQR